MKYRKLRIAWSVAWGALCLLWVILWVRSYWWIDAFQHRYGKSGSATATSKFGVVHLIVMHQHPTAPITWRYWHASANAWLTSGQPQPELFHWNHSSNSFFAGFPHGLALVTTGLLAASPWIRWRFSLRTLLVAMTLIAVGLGVVVYAVR